MYVYMYMCMCTVGSVITGAKESDYLSPKDGMTFETKITTCVKASCT